MAINVSGEIAARLDRLVFSASLKKLVALISLGGAFEFYDLFMTAYIAPGLVGDRICSPPPQPAFSRPTASAFSSSAPSPACGWGRWVSALSPTASGGAPSSRFPCSGIRWPPW